MIPQARRVDLGLVFLLGFLIWLLNHPYQGVRHDAQIYALLAAHWLQPEAFANDLFFRFGSQGDMSLFTPLYGALVGWLGLDLAAWWVVLSGGLLWVGACLALARAVLGTGFAARFALLLGAVLVMSYSPNHSTFILGENFATARSWAIPLGVASVAALAAKRQGWCLALSLAATVLHPLHGIWALSLWLLARLRASVALGLALLPVVVVVLLGALNPNLPHVRLMTGEWLDAIWGPTSDIVFQAPAQSRLPIYAGVLAALWLGVKRGSEESRALYLRLLMLGIAGLGMALAASYLFPVEIVLQGQPWRVLTLLIPAAGVALVDLGQRAWKSTGSGRLLVGGVALLASMGSNWLTGGLCVLATASLLPHAWIDRIEAWIGRWRRWIGGVLVVLALLVLPNIVADWEISGAQLVNPWWVGADWLRGLLTGGNWHVAAVLALALGWLSGGNAAGVWRNPRSALAMIVVLAVVAVATLVTLHNWDRRFEQTRTTQACFLDASCPPHPFREWIAPGSTVFWPGGETGVWYELRTSSYLGGLAAAGRVFSSAKFSEWQRRQAAVAADTDPRRLCADPLLDWVVQPRAVPGLAAQAVSRGSHLYACATLRAVPPAPTVETRVP